MPVKESLDFSILLFKGGCFTDGRIKFTLEDITIKEKDESETNTVKYEDIDGMFWFSRSRGHCLRIRLIDERCILLDGFHSSDHDKLSSFLDKHHGIELQKQFRSFKGWNWGSTNFRGNTMEFNVESKLAFEIPLNEVSRCTTSKNEVTLSFHQHDEAPITLTEMRYHIPTEQKVDEGDPVENFYDKVMNKADTIQATGDAIARFDEVSCLTPRGRYDIKMYATFLQLHGKTFDYKIPYNDILRLFSLPHKDRKSEYFVLHVDPPIKQGQTRYHFLICTFDRYEDDSEIEIDLSEKELKRYDGKLEKKMTGQPIDLISSVMTALTRKKISVPGSFNAMSKAKCVSCSHKASTGFLYPLERGFIFVHKPPVYIRFDELSHVNFSRSMTSTRSFDLEVETRQSQIYTFSSIEKDEYGKMQEFLKKKNIKLKSTGQVDVKSIEARKHDAYLEMMKKEGLARDDDDDDESDEETDEDFVAEGSGSDVAEEFDSDHETSDSDAESADNSPKKKDQTVEKKKPEVKKEKKEKEKEKKAKPVKEKTSKKEKGKKKDKNAPKRPLSAYFIWLGENREKIKRENPGITITEVTKKGSEMWRSLTDKTKYNQAAERAKAKYAEEMEEYKRKLKAGEIESEPKKGSPKKSKAKKVASPAKAMGGGSGSGYKSKEFIEESSSSSEGESPPKKAKKQEPESSSGGESDASKSDSESEDYSD